MIDSYEKLMLGQYLLIQEVMKEEGLDELDKQVRVLSILSGIADEEILHLPIAEYKEMALQSKFLERTDITLHQMAKRYLVGEWELIPVTDYRKLEAGQYIDFTNFSGDMDKNMVELLSTILVPKGHRYNDGYDLLEVQKAIREDMSVADAVSIAGFFLTLCQRSILDSLNYSKRAAMGIRDKKKREEMLAEIERQIKALGTSGDGSQM
jgi:hypothetical protein